MIPCNFYVGHSRIKALPMTVMQWNIPPGTELHEIYIKHTRTSSVIRPGNKRHDAGVSHF